MFIRQNKRLIIFTVAAVVIVVGMLSSALFLFAVKNVVSGWMLMFSSCMCLALSILAFSAGYESGEIKGEMKGWNDSYDANGRLSDGNPGSSWTFKPLSSVQKGIAND